MDDDLKELAAPDDQRINMSQAQEVQYWTVGTNGGIYGDGVLAGFY